MSSEAGALNVPGSAAGPPQLMFYYASKLFWLIVQPSSLAIIAIGLGLAVIALTRHLRFGLRLATGGLAFLLAAGFLPLGNWAVIPLENRFSGVALPAAGEQVAGIIILGGFEDGWVSSGRGGLAINEAGERLTEGVRLARRYPQARVVFTGGVAGLLATQKAAAEPIRQFLEDVGIDGSRIVLEDRSRNTYQNALFTRDLVKPQPGGKWLLVTSAYHTPRSVGVFRHAGFDVIPAPVDYRTRDSDDAYRMFESVPSGLQRLDLAVREWIGLAAYWLTGRTGAIFPAP